jgi:AcrR family transcriptional regulator
LSKRETAKANRRSRILDAARSIIIERGDDGFSMRHLADRSGSSLGTVYSLYGSKQKVLSDLLNFEVDAMALSIDTRSGPCSVANLFLMVDETFARHHSQERYLLYLLRTSFVQSASDTLLKMREEYFLTTIEKAIASSELTNDIRSSDLTQAISMVYTGALLDYSMGRSTLPQFTKNCGLGFALLLLSLASSQTSSFIRDKIAFYAGTQTSGGGTGISNKELKADYHHRKADFLRE